MQNFLLQVTGGEILQDETLDQLMPVGGTMVITQAHQDDAALFSASWIVWALERGMKVVVITVSDGCMGYTKYADAIDLVPRRLAQDESALSSLGVHKVINLGFPDGTLSRYTGRWWVVKPTAETQGVADGIRGKLTGLFRVHQPDIVLTHSKIGEVHPDHEAVAGDVPIAIHDAFGGTWEDEGGEKLKKYPRLLTWMPYSGLPKGLLPDYLVRLPERAALAKGRAISMYGGQDQVKHLMDLQVSAPYEYFCEVRLPGLDPKEYLSDFPLSPRHG